MRRVSGFFGVILARTVEFTCEFDRNGKARSDERRKREREQPRVASNKYYLFPFFVYSYRSGDACSNHPENRASRYKLIGSPIIYICTFVRA